MRVNPIGGGQGKRNVKNYLKKYSKLQMRYVVTSQCYSVNWNAYGESWSSIFRKDTVTSIFFKLINLK